MTEESKTVHIIAGPNGAGKTTFVETFLDRYVECDEFLNADLIAAGLSPFAPERQNLKAAELFLTRLAELETQDGSFAFETTLAALNYRQRIPRWKAVGVTVHGQGFQHVWQGDLRSIGTFLTEGPLSSKPKERHSVKHIRLAEGL